ncbi:MAG: class I lanthipeptide [Gemmatimonadetes bacterium]|nr:class I lanthipeptide [Gemmatimonadota bacterium]
MKKLSLEKTTVRELTNGDQENVVGGQTTNCSNTCASDLASACTVCSINC